MALESMELKELFPCPIFSLKEYNNDLRYYGNDKVYLILSGF